MQGGDERELRMHTLKSTSSVERSWRRRLRLEEAVAPPLDPALVVDPEGIWWDDAGDGGAAMPN